VLEREVNHAVRRGGRLPPYKMFLSHEMKMDVTLKLDQVCHLCGTEGPCRHRWRR
jgi:hypothetical protein